MEPLTIPPGPGIPQGLVVPAAALRERFARSGGPGGQGVNTTDSKVQLSVDLATLEVLTPVQRRRALAALGPRLEGTAATLSVTVTTQRSQVRNRSEARRRLAELLQQALQPPPPRRRRSQPSRAAQARRQAQKRRRSELKSQRKRPSTGYYG